MIAKKIRAKSTAKTRRTGFDARIKYISGKASRVVLVNLAGTWQDAAEQMSCTAALRPTVSRPDVHIVLSWAPNERPTTQEQIAAARGVMAELGAREHQYVIALHGDRPSLHVHVLLNRIHPMSGQALSLNHDYARLELACRRQEWRFGWPEDRGRFNGVHDGQAIRLVLKDARHWEAKSLRRKAGLRAYSDGAIGIERRTGLTPLRESITEDVRVELAERLKSAQSWADFHQLTSCAGMVFCLNDKGAQFRLAGATRFMAASDLGSDFAAPRLKGRLGSYTPPTDEQIAYALETHGAMGSSLEGRADPLLERLRRSVIEENLRRRQRREVARKEFAGIRASQAIAKKSLGAILKGVHVDIAQAIRIIQSEEHRRERAQFRIDTRLTPRNLTCLADTFELEIPAQRRRMFRRTLDRFLIDAKINSEFRDVGGQVDHTSLRQTWHLSAPLGMPTSTRVTGDPCMRAIPGKDTFIVARTSPTGGQVGFELIDPKTGRTLASRRDQDGEGLVIIGKRESNLVVLAVETAAILPFARHAPTCGLFVATGPILKDASQRHLASVTEGKKIVIIARAADLKADAFRTFIKLFPGAKIMQPVSEHPMAERDDIMGPETP